METVQPEQSVPNRTRRLSGKALVKLAVFGMIGLFALIGLVFVARGLASISQSEETVDVFNVAAELPSDLRGSIDWLPDAEDLPREMEPLTRVAVESAWLRGWAQLPILAEAGDTSGLEVYFSGSALEGLTDGVDDWSSRSAEQIGHRLRLMFYSEDGQIISLRSEATRVLRAHPVDGRPGWFDAVETYEAILVLEDGNWRIQHWVRRDAEGAWWTEAPEPATERVPTGLRGINYYPQDHDWVALWSAFDPEVAAADLDRVVDLGLDSVRIFLPYEDLNGSDVSGADLAPVREFLDLADERDLGVVATLFHGRIDHRVFRWDADTDHLDNLVPLLANHPALLMWDLKDAPDADVGVFEVDIDLIHAWLGHMSRHLRSLDPGTPMTIGWGTADAAAAAPKLVDVVSFQHYLGADELAMGVDRVEETADGRPIQLIEFGLPTWNSVLPGGHTELEQAAHYADVLEVVSERDLSGAMAWTLWDFTIAPPEAGLFPWKTGPALAQGVLRVDGSAKPAAAVVGERDASALAEVPRPGPLHRLKKTFWRFVLVVTVGFLALRTGKRQWSGRRRGGSRKLLDRPIALVYRIRRKVRRVGDAS